MEDEFETDEMTPEELASIAEAINGLAKDHPDYPVLARMAEVAASVAHSEQPGVTALITILGDNAKFVSENEGMIPDLSDDDEADGDEEDLDDDEDEAKAATGTAAADDSKTSADDSAAKPSTEPARVPPTRP